jgi:hypothetical protein
MALRKSAGSSLLLKTRGRDRTGSSTISHVSSTRRHIGRAVFEKHEGIFQISLLRANSCCHRSSGLGRVPAARDFCRWTRGQFPPSPLANSTPSRLAKLVRASRWLEVERQAR